MSTKQLGKWVGNFGNDYIGRNSCTNELVQKRTIAFAQMMRPLISSIPSSILEVGANIGHNIKALQRISNAKLHALEPNPKAREILLNELVLPEEKIYDGSAEKLPFPDTSMDMVFTCTVLIHIPGQTFEDACREIYRVSEKTILIIEYFSPAEEIIRYHGEDNMLFKRDYGSIFMDLFPDLELLDYGFFWKRITDLDNVNYWLFRKP